MSLLNLEDELYKAIDNSKKQTKITNFFEKKCIIMTVFY
jgi:hypothetical protein